MKRALGVSLLLLVAPRQARTSTPARRRVSYTFTLKELASAK